MAVGFQGALAGAAQNLIAAPVAETLTTAGTAQPTITVATVAAGVTAYQPTGGVLAVGGPNALGTAGNRTGLSMSTGELWAYGADRTLDNSLYITGNLTLGTRRDEGAVGDPFDLTFSSTAQVVPNTGTPTVTVNDPTGRVAINGSISENAALTVAGNQLLKGGLGELVLGGNNAFTNTLTVSGGVLRATTDGALGAVRNEVQRSPAAR